MPTLTPPPPELKRTGEQGPRSIPRRLIGRVVDVEITATTRVIMLGPPAGQRRLAERRGA